MQNQETENNNKLKNRVIPGIVMSVIFLIVVAIAIIGAHTNSNVSLSFRIISYTIFSVVFAWMAFELYESFMKDWIYSGIFGLATAVVMVFPLDTVNTYIYNLSTGANKTMVDITKEIFSDYASVIAVFVVSVFYIIHRAIFVSNLNIKNIIIKAVIILVTMYAIQISFKLLIFALKYDWGYFMLFVGAAIISDVSGFFFGRFFGNKWFKKKFSPSFSPNKTWEGTIGSVLTSFIFIFSIIISLNLYEHSNFTQGFVIILLPIVPTLGDLSFSAIKRINNTKDFSKILKGHGGFLDRYDSICAIGFLGFLLLLSNQ